MLTKRNVDIGIIDYTGRYQPLLAYTSPHTIVMPWNGCPHAHYGLSVDPTTEETCQR